MYFTQEDYIKIENWLQANSVKDTEFPEASSLSLNEQLTIIQRGENKRIKLEDLVNFLFSQSDSELDTSSTKPIQNQAVARAIYELQNRKFIEIVEELPPTSNAKDNVVYILLDEVGEDNNLFTEWIKVNNTWEKVGEFKAEIDLSPYLKIQDSPFEKGDGKNSAVLKGGNNQATNINEVALGKYNKSNSDTYFSVGIGTSEDDRKNAVEVKANGDIYIEGVEGRIQDKLNATNILDGQLTELSERINNLPQGDDFDKQGNYPLLHVGTADDLAGRGESVPAEFGFRASGGKSIKDGRAYIKRIKGNSVVWNQLFTFQYATMISSGVTVSKNADNSLTCVGTLTDTYFNFGQFQSNIENHKYLFILDASAALDGYSFGLLNRNAQVTISGGFAYVFHTNSDISKGKYIGIRGFSIGNEINENLLALQIDLTKMFGAGNEPSTIEDFNARMATLCIEDMNAYNEGEVVNMKASGIKSVGFNAWDEEWELGTLGSNGANIPSDLRIRTKNYIRILPKQQYYFCVPRISDNNLGAVCYYDKDKQFLLIDYPIKNSIRTTPNNAYYMKIAFYVDYGTTYNHDICINLVHSGYRNGEYEPYVEDVLDLPTLDLFPNGMNKIGDVYDEYDEEKSVQRIGVVDMGTLNFKYALERFLVKIPTMLTNGGILCAKYSATTESTNAPDKSISNGAYYDYNTIAIKDTSYTDAATFKEAMQGVMLYYELAEPIVTELDAEDQFRDYYNVADFGTEMSQSSVPSAPFSADIIYQFNAVDMIREHELEITELQSIITEQQSVIATIQAQVASLTSNF